nr:antibiotic biosynthesis monooxygenase [Streptomyces sp. NBC_00830]WTB35043.1 antibiotic biosynthesis monooxygenase [Streptomyces sp. NBC_00830]
MTLKIKPDRRPQFLAAVEDDATCSVRDESGCLRFEAFQDTTDPDTYHLLEVYRDEQAVAAHRETAHYARWLEAAQEFLAEPRTLVQLRDVLPLALPS